MLQIFHEAQDHFANKQTKKQRNKKTSTAALRFISHLPYEADFLRCEHLEEGEGADSLPCPDCHDHHPSDCLHARKEIGQDRKDMSKRTENTKQHQREGDVHARCVKEHHSTKEHIE